jgi:hypothetical protein
MCACQKSFDKYKSAVDHMIGCARNGKITDEQLAEQRETFKAIYNEYLQEEKNYKEQLKQKKLSDLTIGDLYQILDRCLNQN